MKKAFSIFELVIVIVVLGIVSTIGSNIIATMYKDYLKSKAINRLEIQTNIVLEQIAKRLSHRIRGSLGVIRENGDIFSMTSANENDKNIIWLAKSSESMEYWNGFIDLDGNDTKREAIPQTIATPGSQLTKVDKIIRALTYDKISINGTDKKAPAIIFKNADNTVIYKFYSHVENDYTVKVKAKGDEVFKIHNDKTSKIHEHYDLSHTAYAIICEGDKDDFNLILRYNFQPWNGETHKDGQKAILAEHVSTFRMLEYGNNLRIKLCIMDDKTGKKFSACKEKVVF